MDGVVELVGVVSAESPNESTIEGSLSFENALGGTISPQGGEVTGTVAPYGASMSGSMEPSGVLEGSVSTQVEFDNYAGSYEVVPSTEETVLPTADKLMSSDVTVKEIPIYRVSNDSGTTITIGVHY